jgi:DNA helicase-2/ATP-dependent DNA helicase PcrA
MALRMVEQHQLVREVLEASYPWFAIDEYQDLGYPFHRMMTTLLTETDVQVFAIGDPDQCIYEELQGTSPRYILELAEQIRTQQGSSRIELLHNYRCAPRLIEVSERILGTPKPYRSSKTGGTCFCYPCQDFEEQQELILEGILPSLLDGCDEPDFPLGEIAILHPWRGKLDGEGVNRLSQALEDLENDWSFTLDKDVLYDSRRSKIIEWLERVAQWCMYGWETGEPYFRDLLPFWFRLNADPQSQLPVEDRFKLERDIFSVLWELRRCRVDEEIPFADWINTIRQELNLDCLLAGYRIAAPDDVSEFERIVEGIEGGRLSSWPLSRFAKGPGRMQLTTLHSSKGTQFRAVIIAGLDKLGWFSAGLSEEDRRLAYVAVTRAKRRLYLLFEGMPEILEDLRKDPPEGCYFHERLETANGSAIWQRPLF